ncbi:DUF5954 family protein [Streptomyces sp. NPDC057521]|uniref:DUF5954 family protein n=1 Tax=Streptomyces sp. NPDC057521 TaxID=3346156 RepID=UPI003690CABB
MPCGEDHRPHQTGAEPHGPRPPHGRDDLGPVIYPDAYPRAVVADAHLETVPGPAAPGWAGRRPGAADAVNVAVRGSSVVVPGPLFGVAAQSEGNGQRWLVIVDVTHACPQQPRDALNFPLLAGARTESVRAPARG